jgi:predicted transposase YdaD
VARKVVIKHAVELNFSDSRDVFKRVNHRREGRAMVNHDRLFKELLTTFFVDFIDLFLPKMVRYIDKSSIEFLDKEIFTDVTAGARHEADLIVKAKFKGKDSFFLVLIETQAQHQPDFNRRLFSYFARLHEKYAQPVYPVALLSFERPQAEQPHVYEVSFPDLKVLQFRYPAIQLNRLDWRSFLKRPNPAAAALIAKMNIAQEDRPKVQLECSLMLARLKLDPARQKLISGFVDTYLKLTAAEMTAYELQCQELAPKTQEDIMELTNYWERKGIKQGRREGRKQGRQEGAVSLVKRLLQRRLTSIDSNVLEQVEILTPEQIELLSEALLDFTTVADLKRWLSACKQH